MIDLSSWVEAETEPDRQEFRQAVHLVLRAIAESPELAPVMIMKGGILLAVRYRSTRFTRDIDFSTSSRYQVQEGERLVQTMQAALAPVSADNDYGLALRLQSYGVKPANRPDVSFPTLQMRCVLAMLRGSSPKRCGGWSSRGQPRWSRWITVSMSG